MSEFPQLDRCRRLMIQLTLSHPILGLAAARTDLKHAPENSGIDTAALDVRGAIYINEDFFAKLPDTEARFVLAHELMHLMLVHYDRRGRRHPGRWNMSADRAINLYLKKYCENTGSQPMKAPSCALFPKSHQEEWSAEQMYEEEPEPPAVYVAMPTAGCGPDGGLVDAANPGSGQRCDATTSATWRRLAEMAKAVAREAGSEAGDALAKLFSIPRPKVAWAQIVRRGMQDAEAQMGDDDVSFQKRNRRRNDAYIPGHIQTSVMIAVVIDVSGSVPDDSIAQAIAETASIAKESGHKIYLVIHDAIVQWEGWIEGSVAKISKTIKGRGGTMFEPAYLAVEKIKRKFGCMIHLTDACPCGSWPGRPPNVKRGICALIGHSDEKSVPAWMHKIPVEI